LRRFRMIAYVVIAVIAAVLLWTLGPWNLGAKEPEIEIKEVYFSMSEEVDGYADILHIIVENTGGVTLEISLKKSFYIDGILTEMEHVSGGTRTDTDTYSLKPGEKLEVRNRQIVYGSPGWEAAIVHEIKVVTVGEHRVSDETEYSVTPPWL